MSDSETAHCRLCANLKPYSKLVNLQTDENRERKIVEKLFRLSLNVTNLNSLDDSLAKTICFPCMDSLDTAFNFVINVEASQKELKKFTSNRNLKKEITDNDQTCDAFEEKYNDAVPKEESDINSELDETGNSPVNNNNTNNQKESEDNYDNSITLIQIKLSWKEYSWLCAYCDTLFTSVDELKIHSMEYHGCCNPYRCSDCNIRKLNLDSFVKHVNRHRQHLKLSCYKCHMTFSRQYDTIQHKKLHMATEFKCQGCNETFATMQQSIEHRNNYNKDKKIRNVPKEHLTDDFTCVFCPKQFKQKAGLAQHLLIHTDRKRDHTCEKCGKCFFTKSSLSGHMMLHDGSRPHQCEICKHCFRTLTQLRSHIGIHDGKKPFSCEQCGRLFRLKRQLISHSIIHTDLLPYICAYCQKRFRFKTILNQHLRQHTGIRPYICQVCQRDFTNWPNYNKHMKRRHDMNMAKRKHSALGVLPTGEVDAELEINKTAEWKKKILDNSKRPGRPKKDGNVKKIISKLSKIIS